MIDVHKVFSSPAAYLEREVTVGGRLLIRATGENILVDSGSGETGPRIRFSDKRVAEQLLRKLPAYGGGDFIFDEQGTVTGTLVSGASECTDYVLVSVRAVHVDWAGGSVDLDLMAAGLGL